MWNQISHLSWLNVAELLLGFIFKYTFYCKNSLWWLEYLVESWLTELAGLFLTHIKKDTHVNLHIWELPNAITHLLPLATEQLHCSNLGFLPSSRTTPQQLPREQRAFFIYFLNPNWQPLSHQPIPYPLGFSGLTSSFLATLHFTLTALWRHSAVTTHCGCWAAPLKQLGVNCYFQGHFNQSCSFRLQLCPTVPLT